MNLIVRWIIGAIGLYLTVWIGDSLHLGLYLAHNADGAVSAFAVIAVLTLVNAIIRPVVMFFFAGLNCMTLGLFSFVVNAAMFMLVSVIAEHLHLGFHVRDFVAALFGSACLSVITGLLSLLIPDRDDKKRRSR